MTMRVICLSVDGISVSQSMLGQACMPAATHKPSAVSFPVMTMNAMDTSPTEVTPGHGSPLWVVAELLVVQTEWHASSRSRKIRTCDSGPYAIPGLPRPSGLLQLGPLQSQHDYECRPPVR